MDLDEIKRVTEAATEGPWETEECTSFDQHGAYALMAVLAPDAPDSDEAGPVGVVIDVLPADAEFIALARTALPELVAEVERLRSDYTEAQETYAALHASWEAAEATIERVRDYANGRIGATGRELRSILDGDR